MKVREFVNSLNGDEVAAINRLVCWVSIFANVVGVVTGLAVAKVLLR